MEEGKTTEVVLEPAKKSKILTAVRTYWKKGAIVVVILAAVAGAIMYLNPMEDTNGDTNGDTV